MAVTFKRSASFSLRGASLPLFCCLRRLLPARRFGRGWRLAVPEAPPSTGRPPDALAYLRAKR